MTPSRHDRPIGFADLDADSSATPRHSTAAPKISPNLSDALASGTASTSANTRFVVSNGSTKASDRCPIDHAASTWPAIMHRMPAEPARGAQQVRHQAQAEEPGVGLPFGGVLLEDEPGADHERGQQGKPVVEADVEVHGGLARRPASTATSQT